MRLLSIVQWHHFAYMIISVALLGYGVSGTFLSLFARRLRGRFRVAYLVNASLFGLAAAGSYLAAQALPFNALEILWDPAQPMWLALIYLLLLVPFFLAANCICLALTEFSDRAHKTYAVDLLGAGFGAAGIIVLLYWLAPMTALKVVSACGLLAAWLACLELRIGGRLARLSILAAIALILLPSVQFRPEISQFKALSQALEAGGAEIVDERSSPLGLLTTVRNDRVPFRHAPGLSLNAPSGPPRQLGLFTDAEGLQAIAQFDGRWQDLEYLRYLTSALPYRLLPSPNVLVLGAGAGIDLWQALLLGASSVDAVELDPLVVDLVENRLRDFSGNPYAQPGVRLHIDDARGFLAGNEEAFDVIQMNLLGGQAAAATGLQALGENYLYTIEGFSALIDALSAHGVVAITRWIRLPPRDGLRAVATAVAALESHGFTEPGAHLAMIRGWSTSTLLFSKAPISASQVEALRAFCEERSFDVIHYPGMRGSEANRFNRLQQPWYHRGVTAILGPDRERFFADYKFSIRPATDDRPYFFQFLKWGSIPEILRLKGQGGLPLLEQGYLALVLTLAQSVVISLVLVLLPLSQIRATTQPAVVKPSSLTYFLLIGTAFMLIEIAFIQKFILFLHHPTFAVATVLTAFLMFAGLGSAVSGRLRSKRPANLPVIAIVFLALAYLVALPWMFSQLPSTSLIERVLLTVSMIAPLATVMGMLFPLGIRALSTSAPELVPWAWGVNGCASVVSAVAATLLAVHAGFSFVIVLAAVMYAAAAVVFPRLTATAAR